MFRQTRPILAVLAMAAFSPPAMAQGSRGDAAESIGLSYQLYGHGFHVLDITVEMRLTPDAYSVRLHDHSVGFLSLMLHANVTSTATGRFKAGQPGVQPVHFESSGYSRGARRNIVLDYIDGNPKVELLTPAEPKRDPVDIASARGSIDTLSAMAALVRQVQQTGRCDGKATVFDGLRLSQVDSRTVGQQTVPPDSRSPYGGTALRCDFESLEVGGFLHDEDEAKMRKPQQGTAWVAVIVPGAPALPIRIMFENPKLGSATMFLTKVEANPAAPGG